MEQRSAGGFTLLELMALIVTIGVFTAVAIPKFVQASTKAAIEQVKEDLTDCKTANEVKDLIVKLNNIEIPEGEEFSKLKRGALEACFSKIRSFKGVEFNTPADELKLDFNSTKKYITKEESPDTTKEAMEKAVDDFLNGEWEMKALPFEKVKTGQAFRDVDGTVLMRTSKAFGDNEGRTPVNCAILISNKTDLSRGDLISKTRDIYCEVLDQRELSELRLVDVPDDKEISEE